MSILYHEGKRTLCLNTKHSSYQMRIDQYGYLHHLYYGARLEEEDLSYLCREYDRSCAGNPDEAYPDRRFSLNVIPQEYTGCGIGDFRVGSLGVRNGDGSFGACLQYAGHEILKGKYALPGLPASHGEEGEAETLRITLRDKLTALSVDLYYGVFPERDVITRAACIRNEGKDDVQLLRAFSFCLDFPYGEWDLLHFYGKHCLERQLERQPVLHSVSSFGSDRGASSHQHNPFLILCEREAGESHGDCYGFMLAYSGGFKAEVELDQLDSLRVVMGLQDEAFSWVLKENESFYTPEAILAYSGEGLAALSHRYHDFLRRNVCRSKYSLARRPVLLNNWEGTYFDFDDEKLLQIAQGAADLGVEMFVLDDGWFGARNSDNAGLGDWFVNEDKIRCGLRALSEQIHGMGLQFGIWIEPEMVNEDSDLYRAHPEWVLAMPGRKPVRCRNQLVLDMGREEVRAYLYGCFSKLLSENRIDYVKWDMNRSLSDVYSNALPRERQGEAAHRYVLGVYDLMDRLTSAFPDVLFEGCAGGGGRFDAGILYYSPQIWCSDDTDPIHRLRIQYGTSFGYPISSMGAHVSASPNHQTGRTTHINTRAVVAMSGTFGYELDPAKLSDTEKEEIRRQIRQFKQHQNLVQYGLYYRLTAIGEQPYEAWQFTAEDQRECLVNLVITNTQSNPRLIHLRLKGLAPEKRYQLAAVENLHSEMPPEAISGSGSWEEQFHVGMECTGQTLMHAGYTFPWLAGDYPVCQLWWREV